MKQTTVRALKAGEWFTLKPTEYPTEKEVYIRDEYDRETKKYICGKWCDISASRLFKGDKVVYTGFTF